MMTNDKIALVLLLIALLGACFIDYKNWKHKSKKFTRDQVRRIFKNEEL